MATLFWLVVLIGTPLALAYRRTDLRSATGILVAILLVFTWISGGGFLLKLVLWVLVGGLVVLNFEALRRDSITARLLKIYRRMLPTMSKTEQDALEAGNVWWEGELFSGIPDWRKLSPCCPPS